MSLKSDHNKKLIGGQKKSIPRIVWILGFIMFFLNLATVMVYSFRGIYIKTILKSSTTLVGFLEGITEATSFLMKLFSGVISDVIQKRKPIMLIGYIFTVISRPLLAISKSFLPVLFAALSERLGNGLQATPRDAMVADVAPKERIGASFGLKRSLGTVGSFFGAVCGYLAIKYTDGDYQKVFAFASIPGFFALIIFFVFVKETKKKTEFVYSVDAPMPVSKKKRFNWKDITELPLIFWMMMAVNGVFMLSRMGETFLMLHAHRNLGFAVAQVPMVMMLFNVGWCVSSYPVGIISDKTNRRPILVFGIILLILADIILANASSKIVFLTGVLFWGLQYGMTMNVFVSLIAETVSKKVRGTAFGIYYIISATSALCADTGAGWVAEHFGEGKSFLVSGCIATFSLFFLFIIFGIAKKKSTTGPSLTSMNF